MAIEKTLPCEPACAGRIAEERRLNLEAALAVLTNAITYAANRNTELDAALVERLVALRETYIAGGWQVADEQAFWPAYHAFVAGIGVPIDGLILSRWWTRCVAWVAAVLSLAALALLVVQLSFLAGLDSTIRQIDDIERQTADDGVRPSEMETTVGLPLPGAAAGQVLDGVGIPRCVQMMALYRLLSERVASERLLLMSKELPETMTMPDSAATCLESAARSQAVRAYVLGNARILRTARQDYGLPVLFGLLGTIACMLRSLAHLIRDSRLTVTDIVGAAVRIPLGMLAGLAVGWVLGNRTDSVFTQITPWTLAFLAGYSVELLFTAMDRLIGAFTGAEPEANPG